MSDRIVHGREGTDREGNTNGPFAYAVEEPHGASVGLGVMQARPSHGNLDLLTGEAHIGTWHDPQGNENHGLQIAAHGLQAGMHADDSSGMEGGLGTIDIDANWDNDRFSLGADGNLAGGSMTFAGSDRYRGDDQGLRVGVGAGEGLGMRVYYGDRDHDGRPERGLGISGGPVNLDYRTEDEDSMVGRTAGLLTAIGTGAQNLWGSVWGD